jgi:hypothetical protein
MVVMTKIKDLKKKWMKDPAFRREYEALEGEFTQLLAKAKVASRQRIYPPHPEEGV